MLVLLFVKKMSQENGYQGLSINYNNPNVALLDPLASQSDYPTGGVFIADYFFHQLDPGTALSWVLKIIYLTAIKWNQIQSSSKENIIFVAVFCITRHVPGSEEVCLGSYFPYILLVFGQIRNFLFHRNLRQLRDFLFFLNIHFDLTNSALFVSFMNLLLSQLYLIDFLFSFFSFSDFM